MSKERKKMSCMILIFFIFFSFSGCVLANIKTNTYPNIGYNHHLESSKNQIKFNYEGNLLEIEYGSRDENIGVGTAIENGGVSPPGLNNVFSKPIKMSFQGYQNDFLKKSVEVPIDSRNMILRKFKKDQNFSQYVKMNWYNHWSAPLGQTFIFFASMRSDVYQAPVFKQYTSENKMGDVSFFPKTGVEWEGPLFSIIENTISMQPSGKLIAGPAKTIGGGVYQGGYGVNNVAGEGRGEINISASSNNNLSNSTQFQEDDYIIGSRILYGGKIMTTLGPLGGVHISLGQSYPLSKQNSKNEFQQLNYHLSDYVGHIEANPFSLLSLNYSFRLNQKSFVPNFSEMGVAIGPPILSLSGSYVVIHQDTQLHESKNINNTDEYVTNNKLLTKEINFFLNSQVTDNLSLMGSIMQDMQKKQKEGRAFQYGVGAHYHNDRFRLGLTVDRQFYPGIGSKPGTLFMLTFSLNNEGEYAAAPNASHHKNSSSSHNTLVQ